jgi:hypothetical protein
VPSEAIRISRSPQNGGFHKWTGGRPFAAEASFNPRNGLLASWPVSLLCLSIVILVHEDVINVYPVSWLRFGFAPSLRQTGKL